MPLRSIHVIQKHNLGIAKAKDRLQQLAAEQHEDGPIEVSQVQWTEATHTLTFTVVAYGTTVGGRLIVEPDCVEVVTDKQQWPWYADPFLWYAKKTIQTKLAEALKG